MIPLSGVNLKLLILIVSFFFTLIIILLMGVGGVNSPH